MKPQHLRTTTAICATLMLSVAMMPTSTAEDDFPDACMEGTAVMTPYGEPIHGQGASAALLYYGMDTAGRHHWAVSYALETNTMSVGADRSAFYAEVIYEDDFYGGEPHFFEADKLSGQCKYIGWVHGAEVQWWVQGGATGWATQESCNYELWAEVSAGVKFGISGGTEVSLAVGGSYGCENGGTLDSEVLVSETNEGSSCLPGGCEQEAPSAALT